MRFTRNSINKYVNVGYMNTDKTVILRNGSHSVQQTDDVDGKPQSNPWLNIL